MGVDIGGTKVAAALTNSRGEILFTRRSPMAAHGAPRQAVESVFHPIDELLRDAPAPAVLSMGVSVPGWVDSRRGILISAANIPCWHNFPLADKLHRRYKLPVHIGNDANIAALAEAAWGAGRGHANVFYVTVGTGIGTGIVMHNHIYSGRAGGASEGGHQSINFRGPRCGCGKRGCIEAYASGTAIARRARQLLRTPAGRKSSIFHLVQGNVSAVTTAEIAKAASGGDVLARRILAEAAGYFAIWLGNMIDLIEPDVIVIGGGMSRLMMSLNVQIRRQLRHWSANPRHREIPIVPARFGADSAVIGAAALGLPFLK